ncbi:MAG: hypothetical protein SH817_16325 [Leptospira sp.]|nr:hypothetical protein [Leptospira sp.]
MKLSISYTMKRYAGVPIAHIQKDENKKLSFACSFDETKCTLEKQSQPMDIQKMRTIVAKSANADSEICGVCVGSLYAN